MHPALNGLQLLLIEGAVLIPDAHGHHGVEVHGQPHRISELRPIHFHTHGLACGIVRLGPVQHKLDGIPGKVGFQPGIQL